MKNRSTPCAPTPSSGPNTLSAVGDAWLSSGRKWNRITHAAAMIRRPVRDLISAERTTVFPVDGGWQGGGRVGETGGTGRISAPTGQLGRSPERRAGWRGAHSPPGRVRCRRHPARSAGAGQPAYLGGAGQE